MTRYMTVYFNLGAVIKYLNSTDLRSCVNLGGSCFHCHFTLQKDVLKQVDWKTWLHKPGLPPVNMIDW